MYRYEIWTRHCPPYERKTEEKPTLWVECKTLKEVGRYLDLTPSQVRERISWSRNVKLGSLWHVKYGGFGYQILRFNDNIFAGNTS